MANFLYKVMKKPSALRVVSSCNNLQQSSLGASFVLPQTDYPESKSDFLFNPNPILASIRGEKSTDAQPLLFFPSSPFGYCLSHVSTPVFDPMVYEDAEDVVPGKDHSVWADSVKKKRKRKMNKHKYKKLRKRLRRKT